jgi:hypothetical protein
VKRTYETCGKVFTTRKAADRFARNIANASGLRVPVYETTGAKQARIAQLKAIIAASLISVDNGARVQLDGDGRTVEDFGTCGTCGMEWNDALITSRTPAPSGRCPYESIHEEIEELKRLKRLKRPQRRVQRGGACVNDHEAMLLIQELLDGVEWTPSTLDEIAEILTRAGYRVRDLNEVDR